MSELIIQVRHVLSGRLILVDASQLADAWERNVIDVAREPPISGGTYEEQQRLRQFIKDAWDSKHQLWEKLDESEQKSLKIAQAHFLKNGNQWTHGFELDRVISGEDRTILDASRRLRKIRQKGGLERSYDSEGRVMYRLPQERLQKQSITA